jgi:hypothetical protein
LIMRRPRLLDLCSGAGGAARGYQLAGWHVTGVDIAAQPHYAGDEFHQGDALEFLIAHGNEFDAVHASPPCQSQTCLTKGTNRGRSYVNLIPAMRGELCALGRPWVMENVVSSEVRPDIVLCGLSFGLRVFRHRVFELGGWMALQPPHPSHRGHRVAGWRHGTCYSGDMVAVYGDGGGKGSIEDWRMAMDIDWMPTRRELAEAIPPAYTLHLGTLLVDQLSRAMSPAA